MKGAAGSSEIWEIFSPRIWEAVLPNKEAEDLKDQERSLWLTVTKDAEEREAKKCSQKLFLNGEIKLATQHIFDGDSAAQCLQYEDVREEFLESSICLLSRGAF